MAAHPKPLLLAALVTMASVFSLFSAITISSAANAVVSLSTTNDKALAYSYYKIVEGCFHFSNIEKNISSSKAKSPGDWVNDSLFGVNSTLRTGFLVNDSGADNCKAVLPKAISFWQIDPVDFLKGVGYKLNNNGTEYVTTSSNQQADFTNYMNRTLPGSGTLTPAISYALDYAALTTGCKPDSLGPISQIKDEAVVGQINSNSNDYFAATLANNDGSTTAYGFQGGAAGIDNYGAPGDKPSGNYVCRNGGIADNVSKDARALAAATTNDLYVSFGNTLFGGLSALESADCNSQPNTMLKTECRDGWRTAFNTCFASYKNTASLSAQNGPNGDTTAFVMPTKENRVTIATCISKATGADPSAINDALAAAAQGFQLPTTEPVTGAPGTAAPQSSCRIDGIGWILCPVVNFMAGIVDNAYRFIEALLVTPALNTNTSDPRNGTYTTWAIMRNIANVAFVIAFIIIIYSQLTGMGVTNYGIKKLLPKLIAAAILVNVSYWICAVAVDISNIIGGGVYDLINSIANKVPLPPASVATTGGSVWGPLAATVLASTTVAVLGLTILLPLLIAALAAIVTALVVLVLRQALIVILIIVSPLAFVALLLPNTESLFKKWKELLQVLLLMFPIVAMIFAGSKLASRAITSSSYSSITGDAYNGNMMLQIVGAGVAIIPLFIVPTIMKVGGGLLNRFAGFTNNPNKGMFDRMRKGAEGVRKRQEGRRAINSFSGQPNLSFGKYKRAARRRAIDAGIERNMKLGEAGYVASKVQDSSIFQNQVAGGTLLNHASQQAKDSALGNAIDVRVKLDAEEVKAAQAVISNLNLDLNEKNTLEKGGQVTKNGRVYQGGTFQKAALSNAVAEQRMSDIEAAMTSTTLGEEGAKHLADSINQNYAGVKAKAAHLVDGNNLVKLGNGEALTDKELNTAMVGAMGGMSPELMATQKSSTLKRIIDVKTEINNGVTFKSTATDPNVDTDMLANVMQTADRLTNNKELFDKVAATESRQVNDIKS